MALAVSALGAGTPAKTSIVIERGSLSVSGSAESGATVIRTTAAAGLREPAAVLVLLGPDVRAAELLAFLAADKARDADSIVQFGEIVLDAALKPGSSSEVQSSLAPGTYVALNAEGEHSRGWSHAVFTVSAAPEPATLPAAAALERTIDFAFKGPRTLSDGELVRFENEGFLAHIDEALPTRGRRSAQRLAHDLLIGHEAAAERLVSAAPVILAGPLSAGALQQSRIAAPPGWYVQSCMLEIQDGRSQAQLGMERVIRVLS
jgi:hypothetical protein